MRHLTRILFALIAVELLIGGLAVARATQRRVPLLPEYLADDSFFEKDLLSLAEDVRQSGSAENWLTLGQALLGHGYYDHAELAFRNAVELAPHNQEARFGLAFCLDRTGRMAESELEYREAIKLNDRPNSANRLTFISWLAIGRNLLREEKAAEAEAVFRQTVEFLPQRFQLAKLLIRSGRAAEALPFIEQGQKELPDSLEFQYEKYQALRELNQPAEAQQVAFTLEQLKHSLSTNFNTGYVGHYRQLFGVEKEVEEYNQLLKKNDMDVIAAKLSSIMDVIVDRRNPRYQSLRLRLAEAEIQRGNGKKILELVNDLTQCGISDADVLQLQGAGLELEGQPAAATAVLKRALQMAPDATLATILAEFDARNGDSKARNIHLALADRLQGEELYREAQGRQAIPLLERAVQRNPEDATSWYDLGNVRLLTGAPQAALQAYEQCVKLNPSHGRALDAIASLQNPAQIK